MLSNSLLCNNGFLLKECSYNLCEFSFFSGFWGLKEEMQRTNLELDSYKEKVKENQEKIKLNKQLPYLVGNIVEVNFYGDFFFCV